MGQLNFANLTDPEDASPTNALTATEKQTDIDHLREIYKALQAYRSKDGRLPGWLSDLVPGYLSDTNVLVSPVERRTGQSQLLGYGDPKVHSSYIYEFNNSQAGGIRDQDVPLTMREWKTLQMEEFGPVIPILRCHLYEKVLNLSYSGEVYESGLYWETDTNTLTLMERLGPGPGSSQGRKLRVLVQDASDGKPLPGVSVVGTNRQSEFGPLPPRKVTSGSDGTCDMNLGGKSPKSLKLLAEKSGFAREVMAWGEGADIPETVTLKLRKASVIGGFVLGTGGKPLKGAVVTVNGLTKDAVGQVLPAELDRVETGPDGKWRSVTIPVDFESLSFTVSHPEYMPGEFDQVPEAEGITAAALKNCTVKFELQPAIEITGTVKDTSGKPVFNASVQLLLVDEERQISQSAKTDGNGSFKLFCTSAGGGSVVVQAKGLAAAWCPLTVEPGVPPLQFALDAGRSLGGQVKDDEGKPVQGAQVTILTAAEWTNASPLNLRTACDEQGRFAFRALPTNSLAVQFQKEGFSSNVEISPAGEATNWVVTLSKPFQLTGKVVDSETGEPVKKFTVWRGRTFGNDMTYWNQEYSVNIDADGGFKVELSNMGDFPASGESFAVKAEGYAPEKVKVSGPKGTRNIEFRLKKGKGLAGVLVDKDGNPVEGATIVLAGSGSPAYMDKGGEFRRVGREQDMVKTDAQGRFEFQPALDPSGVAACHEKGFVELKCDDLAKAGKVVLQPWASVKGSVKLPASSRERTVGLHAFYSRYGGFADRPCSVYLTSKIAEDGTFGFDKVPPGERRVYIVYKTGTPGPIPLSHGTYLKAEPGQSYTLNFGDTGRTVIGRVNATGEYVSQIDWQRDFHTLKTKFEPAPQDQPFRASGSREEQQAAVAEYNKKQREFWSSEEGLKRQREEREFILTFENDGSFAVHGVPPGKYTLSIRCSAETDNSDPQARFRVRYGMEGAIGSVMKEVEIPEPVAGEESKPVDLGTFEMGTSKPSLPGPTRVITR